MMKTFTSLAMAFFLALAVVPAMAADQAGSDREPVTFQAFTQLPATEREVITPLTDTELAAVEGSSDVCLVCLNLAFVTQTNAAVVTGVGIGGLLGSGLGVAAVGEQSNSAKVDQDIN